MVRESVAVEGELAFDGNTERKGSRDIFEWQCWCDMLVWHASSLPWGILLVVR